LKVTDESNGLRVEDLSPKLQEFVRKGRRINRLGQPFCVKDFPELRKDKNDKKCNLFRQTIYKLRKLGWIVTVIKGWYCYYRITGENTGYEKRMITQEGMEVGTNMQDIINESSKQIPAMHDIKIKFSSKQLYKNAIKKGLTPNPQNKGIFLEKLTLARDVYAQIAIYPELVTLDISCTWEPFIYDIRGAQEFIGHVAIIYSYLVGEYQCDDFPESLDWVTTQYHLNQDGQTEFSDPKFRRTISDITGGLIREYAKRFEGKKPILRSERIFTPNCTIKELLNDMEKVGKFLYSDDFNISHLLPSQILGLNAFAQVVKQKSSYYNPTHYGVYSL